MIVELLDYRPQRNKEPTLEKPERTRVVLHPNAETIWADICSLNQKHGGKGSDRDPMGAEARLLVRNLFPFVLWKKPLTSHPTANLARNFASALARSKPS